MLESLACLIQIKEEPQDEEWERPVKTTNNSAQVETPTAAEQIEKEYYMKRATNGERCGKCYGCKHRKKCLPGKVCIISMRKNS